MSRRTIHALVPAVGLVLFGVVLAVLHRELAEVHLADVVAEFHSLPADRILLAVVLTVLNYFVLTAYDSLSFRLIRHPLEYRKVAFASFLGYVFSHNVGLSFLGGNAVRLRMYSAWGVSAGEIAEVMVFNAITLWMGFLALAGIGLIFRPELVLDDLSISAGVADGIGALALFVLASYLTWSVLRRAPLRWRNWEFPLPPIRVSLEQLALSSLDWALAAGVLYALVPHVEGLSFVSFLGAFLFAQAAGLVSHVPAGLGVFDAAIVAFLSPEVAFPAMAGALLAYRIIYYLMPLIAAGTLLGIYEIRVHRQIAARVGRAVGSRLPEFSVPLLTMLVFLSGLILLISGAIEPQHSRLEWLADILPLSVIEGSHFAGSIIGVLLLLLARGLQQRIDAAWSITLVFLVTGAGAMLLKGLHIEEATLPLAAAMLLWPARAEFYRRSVLLRATFTPPWIAAIVATVVGATWLLIFSYKRVEYASELWWQFELSGHAARSLRAMSGVSIVLVVFGFVGMLRPAHSRPPCAGQEEMSAVESIVAASTRASAHLALLGDKRFFFNEQRTAMVMYGTAGRTWVAMGDPVGNDRDVPNLIWSFCEEADRQAVTVAFYEVGPSYLPIYLDLGMVLVKLGEEARVDLSQFTLEGGAHKSMRQHVKRVERAGGVFDLIPSRNVPALLDDLEGISKSWLVNKNTREKRFSLGCFDRAYVSQTPVAVVRYGCRIVAFSNLWLGAEKKEMAPDLMRYSEEAPAGVMDYLFTKLMEWGQHEGYRWFNLGMAPLSGIEARDIAPLRNRLGAFLFRHGEHFYNFRGLRQYKEKFDPIWSPHYLAIPSLRSLPSTLVAVAILVSGGLTGVVRR